MPKRATTQPCPECGGVMRYERHDDVLRYRVRERTITTTGWWCAKCGEGILSGEALKAHEKAFLALKAEVDGVLAPDQVAAARQKLGLSQRRAGELLGGGPRAFQKYESGAQAASTPMSNLLRLLANEPSRLEEIIPTKPSVRAVKRRRGSGGRDKRAAG
jgi:HTH-type transcriptional regulator / antitoxin MqsA